MNWLLASGTPVGVRSYSSRTFHTAVQMITSRAEQRRTRDVVVKHFVGVAQRSAPYRRRNASLWAGFAISVAAVYP